jgi:hypothetical protein
MKTSDANLPIALLLVVYLKSTIPPNFPTLTQIPLTSNDCKTDGGAYEISQSNSNCRSICGSLDWIWSG